MIGPIDRLGVSTFSLSFVEYLSLGHHQLPSFDWIDIEEERELINPPTFVDSTLDDDLLDNPSSYRDPRLRFLS